MFPGTPRWSFTTEGDMDNTPDSQRTILVLSIWTEMAPGKQLAWRGSIRTIDGQRMRFRTLAGLNQLVCELSGWQDALAGSLKDTLQTDPLNDE